jgi:hypothetical protein
MDDEESDAGDTADGETDEGDENGGDDRSKRRERLGSRENFWGG